MGRSEAEMQHGRVRACDVRACEAHMRRALRRQSKSRTNPLARGHAHVRCRSKRGNSAARMPRAREGEADLVEFLYDAVEREDVGGQFRGHRLPASIERVSVCE
eukprot:2754758-Rhodomonas_salina.1